ncbi:MAG: metallophosphoesterase [Chlamydiota bacterium]|nr:metallophosphoesterase [Chlamydiota bacterium]
MKRIIHLSDLHIGYRHQNLTQRFDSISQHIIEGYPNAFDYIIVITGDTVDDATIPYIYDAVCFYIKRLESAGFQVLMVPGNHDYGTGSYGDKKFVRIYKDVFFDNPDLQYPKLDIIDDIAFIGLDSMAEELHWYDRLFAQGELGEEQLLRLHDLLQSVPVRTCLKRVVYMHHHPFDPWPLHELKDSSHLGEVLLANNNVDALLYGHNHQGRKHHQWGIARCYDGGSSTQKYNVPCVHRIIDLSKKPEEDIETDLLNETSSQATTPSQKES